MSRNIEKRKLDNSAKIFPIVSSKKYSSVFRISTCLNEEIDPEILQYATQKALKVFSSFKVKLKGGFFWYYYAKNEKEPIVQKEPPYPCKYIEPKENNDYLFKVTYQKNKINIDIFHALTDGNSGTHFFKEIIYYCLEEKHKGEFNTVSRLEKKVTYTVEDAYITNYDKKLTANASTKKAYILKGKLLGHPKVAAVYEIINLEQLKKQAKSKECTVTQYLSAVLINSIYKANYVKNKGKKPIKVCIPVDLKKYFKSETINNFFSYITIEANVAKDGSTNFEDILKMVKSEFKKRLTETEIKKTMSANVRIGKNILIGVIPLFLKKILVKLSYIEIRKYTTTTFSNVGRIGIIGEYNQFIEKFMLLIAPEQVEKIKCSACSYNDKLVFTFTSTLEGTDIEEEFYNILKGQGIEVKIEDNGVHKLNIEK